MSKWSSQVEIDIPFHDVDMLAIAWHGHYAKYFEIARCKLLDSIDYNYPQMCESGYAWPVIDMHIRYIQALNFKQKIIVEARIAEYEYRLKIEYKITDSNTGKRLSKGHTIQVAVELENNEMCFSSPGILRTKLGFDDEALIR